MEKSKTFIEKTRTGIGMCTEDGKVIVPPLYKEVSEVKNFLTFDEERNICTSSDSIYLAVNNEGLYDLYTKNGKVKCPFAIKYPRISANTLYALMDKNTYWNIVALDTTTNELSSIYDFFITDIQDIDYNHIVCILNRSDHQHVFSLEKQTEILDVVGCEKIELHKKGIYVTKANGQKGFYNYSGEEVLPCDWDGIKEIADKQLIRVFKNDSFGIYSYEGKEILSCNYSFIHESAVFHHQGKTFFLIDALQSTTNTRILYYLAEDSTLKILHSGYNSISFEAHQKLILEKNTLAEITTDDGIKLNLSIILSADKIEPLQFSPYFKVWKNGKVGVLDNNGKTTIVPQEYKDIEVNEYLTKIVAHKSHIAKSLSHLNIFKLEDEFNF